MDNRKACIVQRDRTVLLECGHATFEEAREQLVCYAELVKSPSSFHTYRITPLSLWNAASSGWSSIMVKDSLQSLSRWDVPSDLLQDVHELISRYGKLTLYCNPNIAHQLILRTSDQGLMDEIFQRAGMLNHGMQRISATEISLNVAKRGLLKQELTRIGYPVLDLAGYDDGQALSLSWKSEGHTDAKALLHMRDYQNAAVKAFEGSPGSGGSGVVVLPCGSGKTVIGIAIMAKLQCETLILTSNTTSVRQWIDELNSKTTLNSSEVGEYSGQKKEVKPVTVATYQILTHRKNKASEFEHMKLFNERRWGLIIYDEVHLLPAPVFRATAEIQATRRLGLTATLIREDGCEQDVFSLVGPKRYDMPWRQLEAEGWIAKVDCIEIRVPMPVELKNEYHCAEGKHKFRIAAENPAKLSVIQRILQRHSQLGILVIGQYLDQLEHIASSIHAPLITGKMPQHERTTLYDSFRKGEITILVVSKVANFAVDLPEATVAIEVSGSFGSRQEEAQRLGRILRPKLKSTDNKAYFYTLVSKDSKEEDFAIRRQLFLIEQGYEYAIQSLPDIEYIPIHDGIIDEFTEGGQLLL
ncbi:DNA repair helicase XPB [Paenibacillus crassostreae]|uniref:DNA repair helicase XPB n=1 Tax=Paenibacillus crassostreae TaxID=1763538 RepID=UPI000837D332|nr:DNA repair helicase XPB [Paenibacillus crassostreae]AOZ91547.1 helicase [Paenibacillus crassostreae]